jgi:hypothetical protein
MYNYIYIIIIIGIIIFIYYYISKTSLSKKSHWKTEDYEIINNEITFNLKNENYLNKYFSEILFERINLLKKMSYIDWIKYNRENKLIKINNISYYIFIYEKNIESELKRYLTFINRVSSNKNNEDVSFDNIYTIMNDSIERITYKVDPFLIKNMFYSNNNINNISYYWIHENNKFVIEESPLIKNKAVVTNFKKNNIEGVIGISYIIENIYYDIKYKFYNLIYTKEIILLFLFIFIISIILQYINSNIYNSLIFILCTTTYIIYYLSQTSELTNFNYLNETSKDITTSTLSIAFLISANIFIISFMGTNINKKYNPLYYSNIILFCVSMILLLASLYKKTAIISSNDIRKIFILKELLYNLVIILNLLIIFNYMYHIKIMFDLTIK